MFHTNRLRVLALWVSALAVASILAIVPVYLAIRSWEGGEKVWAYLLGGVPLRLLWNSVSLAAVVLLLASFIALPSAWLTTRSDLRLRPLWTVLLALPLAMPTYVAATVLIGGFGPGGVVTHLFKPWGFAMPSIYGFHGAAIVLALFSYPYLFLPLRAAFQRMNPHYEEAARSLGYGRFGAFVGAALPMVRPAYMAGALLVVLYVLSDFGAVAMLRFDTFTRVIFLQYQSSFDRSSAALLSLVLILLTFAILWGELRVRGRQPGAGRQVRLHAPQTRLGAWQLPALLWSGFWVFLSFIVPLGVLLISVWQSQPWELLKGPLWKAVGNSLGVSMAAGLAGALAAFPLAWLSVRHSGKRSLFLERFTYGGFALPGTVIALAFVFFTTRTVPFLYQTYALLVIAYVVRFLPQAVGALRASLLQIPRGLEESARCLGHGPWSTWRKITLPLLLPGFFAGSGLILLTSMKELPATLILGPAGFHTLATDIWSFSEEALYGKASLCALLLLMTASAPMAWVVAKEKS